jgi:hypothetical protein
MVFVRATTESSRYHGPSETVSLHTWARHNRPGRPASWLGCRLSGHCTWRTKSQSAKRSPWNRSRCGRPSPIYERLRALGFNNVFETNFGLVHTPDRTKANMRAFMWDKMKDWLLHGAIEADEKMAADLAGPAYHINWSNLLVLESKADLQERGQASPDDGDALALTFSPPVAPDRSRREGRRGRIRPREAVRRRQFRVDAMTLPGRWRHRSR